MPRRTDQRGRGRPRRASRARRCPSSSTAGPTSRSPTRPASGCSTAAERARLPPACSGPPAGRRPEPRHRPRPAPVTRSRSPATRSWPRPCAGWRRRPGPVGFRVMVEPLAPDGPDATYAALLRAQHADGLVVSGPRVDDPSLAELVRRGLPHRPPGRAARGGRVQRRRRQRRRGPGRRGAPAGPRPPRGSRASPMRRSSTPPPRSGCTATARRWRAAGIATAPRS